MSMSLTALAIESAILNNQPLEDLPPRLQKIIKNMNAPSAFLYKSKKLLARYMGETLKRPILYFLRSTVLESLVTNLSFLTTFLIAGSDSTSAFAIPCVKAVIK